ncbi:hypothetical protein C9I98_08840 [Photobacterium sanctipauli]|uniref:Outer membrane protein beta-barrel domain-containing protein n=1 Tax=Photobacterium sanctipauli TaxID=1342794 RepID=A0A2T3NV55_9GAMM|nr:hypothetical protein [Photobacterium sanctipauli]PSW20154.1 hypothetical protein C9I98_08840 [Photobacterium sanctipauli]
MTTRHRQPLNHLNRALLVAALGFSSLASANNFPYSYFEARVPISPGGLGAAASMQFHPNAHAIVEFESNFDDDWRLKGGVGFHAPINQFTDVHGQAKILSYKNEEESRSMGRLGSELNIGVSAWVLPQLETGAVVGVMHLDDDHTKFNVYARFHAGSAFSLGAEWRIKDIEDQSMMISARYPF